RRAPPPRPRRAVHRCGGARRILDARLGAAPPGATPRPDRVTRRPRLLRIDGPVSEDHAVDRARRLRAHVAFAYVGQHALGLALERIAEATATRVGEAEDVARTERDAAGVEAERPGRAVALEAE